MKKKEKKISFSTENLELSGSIISRIEVITAPKKILGLCDETFYGRNQHLRVFNYYLVTLLRATHYSLCLQAQVLEPYYTQWGSNYSRKKFKSFKNPDLRTELTNLFYKFFVLFDSERESTKK
jgi:hypothetical protein